MSMYSDHVLTDRARPGDGAESVVPAVLVEEVPSYAGGPGPGAVLVGVAAVTAPALLHPDVLLVAAQAGRALAAALPDRDWKNKQMHRQHLDIK